MRTAARRRFSTDGLRTVVPARVRLFAAIATIMLMLAACHSGSGSRSPMSGGLSTSASAVGYSACVRTHGVPNFPDPDSRGNLPKVSPAQLGVSATLFQSATSACARLLQPSQTQGQQTLSGMRDFVRCMRSHGVTNWPDPTTDSGGQAVFDLRGQLDPDSPQIATISADCAPLLHPTPGQNGTVLCNGVGEDGCHHYG
jgi:hypothetical protein